MKALTVQQPWAWAIIHGGKTIENRTTWWRYRGRLAIHAGSRISDRGMRDPAVLEAWKEHGSGEWSPTLVLGAVLGTVELVDIHPDSGCCRPWGVSTYAGKSGIVHLVLADPEPLLEPVPCKGRLGLWQFPDPTQ